MLNAYDPAYVESAWDAWWEKKKFFQVDVEEAKKVPRDKRFIMLLPPPNVTGSLHLGHTLMGAIEDSITRWRRMKGYVSLWVPGTDHAGIATQSVVEKKILKEEGKYRSDFTRDEFLAKVWEWKNEYGNRIFEQFRRIGVGFDLSRNFFTMDDARSVAVKEAFVQLHDREILYRAERMVHWCCALKTAISDVEIDELELDGPTMLSVPLHSGKYEFGVLIDFAYKLKEDPSQEIIVSTTRIETMLGDVAVAVHPEDPRYKHLIGKELIHPFFPDRQMTIIADPVLVQMEFGTGAVKITPAHDPNDFLCGQRNSLPSINIFTDDGLLNEQHGGPFKGMRRYECRNAILKELENLKLFRGKRPNKMVLQRCSKTEDIIEPMVKSQWWVNCKAVAARAIEDVKSGNLKIVPEFQKRTLFEFLENIRDWCVSRQLWWGHRCPAYLVKIQGVLETPSNGNNDHWVAARNEEEALEKASKKFNVDKSKITVTQDDDVLDTWFSSALLPFSVFGWPDTSAEELKYLFPTDLLETGHDIIFFWVARMIFMSYFFLDTLPFHTVFLHPIVRDAQGRKMSKSLGNVIDPLEVIDGCSLNELLKKIEQGNLPKTEVEKSKDEKKKEFPEGIPECGADALRLGLMSYLVQGRNINLDVSRIVSYRFFGNKLWQASKFLLNYLDKDFKIIEDLEKERNRLSFIDKWILNKLSKVSQLFDKSFETYNFGEATAAVYSFWYDSLCPVYIEAVKPIFNDPNVDPEIKNLTKNVLLKVIDSGIKLLHPLMPFITEELYQRLPKKDDAPESICISRFPEDYAWIDNEIDKQGDVLLEINHSILSILSQFKVDKKLRPKVSVYSDQPWILELCRKEKLLLATLSNTGEVSTITDKADPSVKGWQLSVINSHTDVFLDINDKIDIKKETERLNSSLKEKEKYVNEIQSKISKPDYETKVPEKIRKDNAEKLNKALVEIEKIKESIASLSK
jgi:valyl-tRNA synthetase